MKRFLIILFSVFSLTGCQSVAGDLAGQIVLESALRPVVDLAVDGGKAAYQAAEEYWDEINEEEPEKEN